MIIFNLTVQIIGYKLRSNTRGCYKVKEKNKVSRHFARSQIIENDK